MAPPDSKKDPLLGFGGFSSPNFYSNHQYDSDASRKLRDMDPKKQLSSDSPSESDAEDGDAIMSIEIAMNIAQLESDEYATTAAAWWRRVNTLFTENAKAIRAKADAMTKYWDSGAAEKFFMTIGGSLWSLDEWAKAASDNAAQLDALAGAISTYQKEIRKIWEDYKRRLQEAADAPPYVTRAGVDSSGSKEKGLRRIASKECMDQARPHLKTLENAFSAANSKMNLGPAIYMGPENALAVDENALSAALNKMMQQIAANIAANMPKPPMPPSPSTPPGMPNQPPTPPTPPAPPVPPNPDLSKANAPAQAPAMPPTPPAPPVPPAAPNAPAMPPVPPNPLGPLARPGAPAPPPTPPTGPAVPPPNRPAMPPNLAGRSAPTPPGAPPSPGGRSPLSGRNNASPPPLPTGRAGKAPTRPGLGGRNSPPPPMPGMPRTATPGTKKDAGTKQSRPNLPQPPQLPGRGGAKPVNRPKPASFPGDALPPAGRPGTSAPASPNLRGRRSPDATGNRAVSSGPTVPGTKNPTGDRPDVPAATRPAAATRPTGRPRRTPISSALAPDTATTDLGGRTSTSSPAPAEANPTATNPSSAARPGLDRQRPATAGPGTSPGTSRPAPAARPAPPSREPTYETNESEQEKPWTVTHTPTPVLVPAEEVTPTPDHTALGTDSANRPST